MKFDRNTFGNGWIPYTIAGCITVLFYLFLSHLGIFGHALKMLTDFIYPVIIGVAIAYVMDPLSDIFEKKVFYKVQSSTLRRNFSVLGTIITVILFIVILLVALIPQIIDSIMTLLANADTYANTLSRLLRSLGKNTDENSAIDLSGLISSGTSLISKFTSSLPDNLNNIVDTSVNIGKNAAMLVIEFILAIYFLNDKTRMIGGLKRFLMALLPNSYYKAGASFWHRCNRILVRFIACDILDGIIVGIVNFIFMLIAGMPYSTLLSVVIGVTNLAPTFGPIVGAVIGTLIMLIFNPWKALVFLIFTLILQTVDGYIIKPKLFGGQLGVSSVWILIAIIVGGRMFGVVGILLAIPAAAIIDFAYKEGLLPWLENRKEKAAVKK